MSTSASPSATMLRGRWLLLVRAAWVIIATLALSLFVASVPGYVSNVLNPGQAGWMRAVEAPAGLVYVFDLLGVLASLMTVLVCLTLACVLFWRKSDDWMVMFVSSYLLVYGTVLAGPLETAEAFYPGWPSLAVDVIQPLFFTMPTIALFALFPDGRFVPRWTRWLILFSIPLTVTSLYLPFSLLSAILSVLVLGAFYGRSIATATFPHRPSDNKPNGYCLASYCGWCC
jgi:hypothetical protein